MEIISAIIGFALLVVVVLLVVYGLYKTPPQQEYYYSHGVNMYRNKKAPVYVKVSTLNEKDEVIYVETVITKNVMKDFIFQAVGVVENGE